MRKRIVVVVTLALVTAAMMASSLPASAEPISEMSCGELGQAAERAALNLAFDGGNGNRLEALDRAAERKGCDAPGRGGPAPEIIIG